MKRTVKITLIIATVLLVAGTYFGYQIYKLTMGSEPLTGKLDVIPEASGDIPPITEGLADWPNWRGPNFEGKSASPNIVTDWSNGLKKLWHVSYLCQGNATASWSAPVVKGNRLVVTGRDENNDLVFCLNSETGDLIWHQKYEAPATNSHGPGPRATPFIDGDKVYTFGRSGDLVCWQLLDGKMLWRKNVKDEGGSEPQWGYSSTPLVFEDKVIVQGGGTALVVAYDKLSGNLLWKSLEGEAGYAAAIPMMIGNEQKLLVYHGTGLSCLNPSDGKEIWTAKWETDYNVNATTPIISGDLIFHSSGYKMGGQALKVTGASYSALWKNNAIEAQHTDPVLIDGYLYSYSGESSRMNGQFKCVELLTGKEMWSTGRIGQGTATFVAGHLICLDIKGNLYLVKPDPAEFKLIAEQKNVVGDVKHPAWTVPVVANDKLYLRYLQQLICYQLN